MLPPTELEAAFYRQLNAFVEPLVRAGFASPGLVIPSGLVVLETIGRRSAIPRRTPLAASLIEGHIVASTARGARSNWVRNAAARPAVRYWLRGKEHTGEAIVIASFLPHPDTSALPQPLAAIAEGPLRTWTRLGWAFAIIRPA